MKLSNFVTLHADFETYFSPIAMKSGSSSLAKNFAAVFFAGKLFTSSGFVSSDDSSFSVFSGSATGVGSGGYNAPNISFNFLLA